MCLSTMWGAGGGGHGKGGMKQRLNGSPQKQGQREMQQLFREIQVLSREHTIVLRLDMKGIDRPEFDEMRKEIIKAGGILEIEIATFLTNINPDLIAAMNGTCTDFSLLKISLISFPISSCRSYSGIFC